MLNVLRLLLLAVVSFVLAHHARAQTPAWPAVLLGKPFHAGDSNCSDMIVPKPDGRSFTGKFELPPNIRPSVATIAYINIEVAGVSPVDSSRAEKLAKTGTGCNLMLNGKRVAILNALTKSGKNHITEKLQVRIAGTYFQAGTNTLEIMPGRGGGQLDDIEIHRVTVSSRAE